MNGLDMSRTVRAALAVGASVAALVGSVTTAQADPSTSRASAGASSYVRLQVEHSGKCLTIQDGAIRNGAYAVQSTCDASADHQLFSLKPAGSGTFELRAKHSGRCLASSDIEVGQQWCFDDSSQRWRLMLVEVAKDLYELRPMSAPDRCLNIDFWKPEEDGTRAMTWECGHDLARWRFLPA
ncbi:MULTISPECIES: RICIN domain-containing protein [unclassified Streptomyces]|uniref:RICIN domain-containing protein n=1 Tax=Streptomyces sp. NBC_00060 TaxID=2975636 RepID=A0AAU2HD54_9ACTN